MDSIRHRLFYTKNDYLAFALNVDTLAIPNGPTLIFVDFAQSKYMRAKLIQISDSNTFMSSAIAIDDSGIYFASVYVFWAGWANICSICPNTRGKYVAVYSYNGLGAPLSLKAEFID